MNLTWITPNARSTQRPLIIGVLTIVGLGVWQLGKAAIFPGPLEVVQALPTLWTEGIFWDLTASLWICVQALIFSAAIGLPIAYLSRVPVIEPVATFLSKLRFAGSAVFYLPLLLTTTPHNVKVLLLMLGELFYLTTTMQGVVLGIPTYRFDDARTLKMSEWLSVWYVIIRGTVPEAIDAIKDNNGMGLGMIMFVEGIVRSEGGIGVRLFEQDKYASYDGFFAIVILIILTGIGSDWVLRQVKKWSCPYVAA